MSVIFKTLKKLRSHSQEEKGRAKTLKRGRNIYSFRRIFFSPLGALSLILFVFFSGVATFYGVHFIKDYLEQKSKESFLINTEEAQAVKTETGKERDESAGVPPPPKTIPIEEPKPGKLYLPATRKKESPPKEVQTVRYIPPGFIKKPKRQEKKIAYVGAPRESPIPHKETSKALTYTPARLTRLNRRSEINHTSSSSDTPKIKTSPEQDATEPLRAEPDITKKDRVKAPAVGLPSNTLPTLALKERSASVGARQLLKEPVAPKEAERTEEERIQLTNVEKRARIALLVTKIQRSMSTGSSDQIKDLINQLALLKGEENSYVLKLRAFWYLCQDDYKSAAPFLNKVLSKNENDLEAGINMAILEIKTNHLIEARKRLAKLREIYPENTLIPELIQNMK